jgi:hypothetical protein
MNSIVQLASALHESSNLASIDIDGNRIGEAGAAVFLETISMSKGLFGNREKVLE